MISFENDYSELACPQIVNRIVKEANNQFTGYGLDPICESAREKMKKELGRDDVDIHFLVGGTQTNQMVISHMLKPYEAVIAVETGHINTHESGAIEYTGHKVETVRGINGKPDLEAIEWVVNDRQFEHMCLPKAVYISNSTEIGTIYTKADLVALKNLCDKYGLYLYLDGARLGTALTSPESDLTLKDVAELTDIFYIGATKNGAMIGEAVVVCNDELKPQFRRAMKQNGALLAKGFTLGVQFDELFTDGLFFKLAQNANEKAAKLANGLKSLGIKFGYESPTNQIFPIFTDKQYEMLSEKFRFMVWEATKEYTVYRLVTSWHTNDEVVDQFLEEVRKCI